MKLVNIHLKYRINPIIYSISITIIMRLHDYYVIFTSLNKFWLNFDFDGLYENFIVYAINVTNNMLHCYVM